MKNQFLFITSLTLLALQSLAQNQDSAVCVSTQESVNNCQSELLMAQSDLSYYSQQVQSLIQQINSIKSTRTDNSCQVELAAATARRDALARQLSDVRNGGAGAELRSIEGDYLRLERSLPQVNECVSIEEKTAAVGYGSALNLEEARNLSVRNNPRGAREARLFKGMTYCYKYYETRNSLGAINQLNERLNRF